MIYLKKKINQYLLIIYDEIIQKVYNFIIVRSHNKAIKKIYDFLIVIYPFQYIIQKISMTITNLQANKEIRDMTKMEEALDDIVKYNISTKDSSFKKKIEIITTKAKPNKIIKTENDIFMQFESTLETNIFHLISTINKIIIENLKVGKNYNIIVNVTLHNSVITDEKIKKKKIKRIEPTNISFESNLFSDSCFDASKDDLLFLISKIFGKLCNLYEKYQPEYFSTLTIKILKLEKK